jgi:hypothetical protein
MCNPFVFVILDDYFEQPIPLGVWHRFSVTLLTGSGWLLPLEVPKEVADLVIGVQKTVL